MHMPRLRVSAAPPVVLALTTLTILAAPAAMAQEQEATVFEEVIVQAQRREQDIMEVPVAVTMVSAEELEASGIRDVFELQQNVPSLIVAASQTATTSSISIRSIGSTSNNFGVESSVGLYVDGVYRSRQSSIINELVDVEAVEVLRGPQGTLFGKNTAAGALQFRTVRPSHTPDGFFEIEAGDYGAVKLSAASNFSLSENLAMRGTVFSNNRDGYVDDINLGKDLYNDRDRWGARLQLAYNEPSDDFNWRLIADYSEIDEVCCVAVERVDGLYSRASVAQGTPLPGSDVGILATGGTVFTDYPWPAPLLAALAPLPGTIVTGTGFEDYTVAYNQPPRSQNEDSGLSFEFNLALGETTLTSVTALRNFDTFDFVDGDFTDSDIITRFNDVELEALSQEVRLAGDFDNGGNWVAGVYYYTQEMDQVTRSDGGLLLQPYVFITTPELQQVIDGVNLISQLTGGTIPPAAEPFPLGTYAADYITQKQDSWAVFGQADFPLGDAFILTLGGRYTDESKDIDARYDQLAQGPAPDLAAIQEALIAASLGQPFNPLVLLPVAQPNQGWGAYLFAPLAPRPDLNASLSDDQFSGTAKLSWLATDTSMLYLSYSTGYKAGGTNTERISPDFDSIFGPETSESWEIGYKADFRNLRLRVAAYDAQFDDFQANSFTGTGFNLQNAGKLSTQGFEIEAQWRPFDSFEVQGFYAHNEGEFDSFVGGTCWDTWVFHTLMPDPGLTMAGSEVCDRSGYELPYNPEDRAFLALTKDFAIGQDSLYVRAEWSHASSQFTDGDVDPFTHQDSIDLFNLRAGYHFENWNADITAWVRNLSDERWYAGSFDAPIQLGRMNSYPELPRVWGVTFRKRFD